MKKKVEKKYRGISRIHMLTLAFRKYFFLIYCLISSMSNEWLTFGWQMADISL